MKVVAYCYSDPLLDSPELEEDWGMPIDQLYQDLGRRQQWKQLLEDCAESPPETIIVRSWGDLGDTITEVRSAIAQAVSLRQFWLDLSESERRFYFREFIQRIEIIYQTPSQWKLNLLLILNS